jgi:hypothetical protein
VVRFHPLGLMKLFKPFQIRWREKLGRPECPYLVRYTFIFFNYSVRLHHWIRSDVGPYLHDHACNFYSFVLKGSYVNVTPEGRIQVKAGYGWYSKADRRHRLEIPSGGAWTILFCGRPFRKWGFWITETRRMRPLKYFHKYGHPPCDVQ